MSTILSAVRDGNDADLDTLFYVLAFVAFAAALWTGFKGLFPATAACALVGVAIILFAT